MNAVECLRAQASPPSGPDDYTLAPISAVRIERAAHPTPQGGVSADQRRCVVRDRIELPTFRFSGASGPSPGAAGDAASRGKEGVARRTGPRTLSVAAPVGSQLPDTRVSVPAGASADLKFAGELPGCVAAIRVLCCAARLPKWTAALPLPGLHFMTTTRERCVLGPARELRIGRRHGLVPEAAELVGLSHRTLTSGPSPWTG
jgi:hypothetical protein